ncbi:MAG TPA: sulfate ABC transporter ATP-binding protein [Acidovorax sp.]|nr:sulfate ABC transporter ATP-binding protein [Acidovorax sp.]
MADAGTKKDYLVTEKLVKRFDESLAVDEVNLSISKGEIFALLGSSGCGKSTLLRMLAGFETPTSGRILLGGQDVAKLAPYERPFNMMFQSYALFPHLDIWENIAFGLKREGLPNSDIKQRVGEMLDLVQLTPYAKRKPHQLSGGQQQRVALARSLAKKPKVLLLDEPFGALDAKVRKELRRWLRRLHDELHVTSIFVTHDQEEALEVADRVVVINQGRIEQSGSPQQVWDQPASPFVYGFLGDVNLFHGRAHEGLVHLDGMQIDSPEHSQAQNAKAFAYVRPHDLDVERYSPGAGLDAQGRPRGIVAQLSRAIVVGPIARLELIPSDDHKPADNASPDHLIEAQIPAQQFKEMGFKEGETLVVTPRRARVFLDHAAGI